MLLGLNARICATALLACARSRISNRGNAYAEVNRFADAISNFTSLIQINPTVAGYYDNRQYALKSMGRLREALDDANTTIRLAPTYSFGYRSRGNANDALPQPQTSDGVFHRLHRYKRCYH